MVLRSVRALRRGLYFVVRRWLGSKSVGDRNYPVTSLSMLSATHFILPNTGAKECTPSMREKMLL